jgi:hypothetical protein
MANGRQPFAQALSRHLPSVARAAFDRCNQKPGLAPYDRTAFDRWLRGAVPSRRDFVLALADELGDNGIYDAWLEARGDNTDVSVKRVVTSFVRLPPDAQQEAARQIGDHLATKGSPIREQFTMRVELDDWPSRYDLYRLRVGLSWIGALPAQAKVLLLTELDALAGAYEQPDCLFRDVLALDDATLIAAMAELPQSLRYTAQSGAMSRQTSCPATTRAPGVIHFDTPEVAKARIHLDVTYPYPSSEHLFPILFRGYQVRGTVEVRFALRTRRAHRPRSYPFLGQQQDWAESPVLDELHIEVGRHDLILAANTGLVLTWSDQHHSSNEAAPGPAAMR